MQNDLLTQLQKIATLKHFAKDEYICCEGQPGNEMYIILKGAVGVYLTSAVGMLDEISRIRQGSFFGEMSIFDELPRSATCIALEDTTCATINRSNIRAFLENCPEMAEKMLAAMSLRIRNLDNELHKSAHFAKKYRLVKFTLPEAFTLGYDVKEPEQDPQYMYESKQICPLCGKEFMLPQFRRNIMRVHKIALDCRVSYEGCEPIWHDVVSCPGCHYSNHHLSFFRLHPDHYERIRQILREQHMPVIREVRSRGTAFDQLVLRYLQAIHINEMVSAGDNAFIGTLWLNLYWLAKDANDPAFAMYCAQNAVDRFSEAIDNDQVADAINKCSISLSLACLLISLGMKMEAVKYCNIAVACPDSRIMKNAFTLKENLRI